MNESSSNEFLTSRESSGTKSSLQRAELGVAEIS